MPLSVDEKKVALVPNPVLNIAVRSSLGPQIEKDVDLCSRLHSLLPPTLQVVKPFLSPETVHLKEKVSPGQVGGAAVNCAETSPEMKYRIYQQPVEDTHLTEMSPT